MCAIISGMFSTNVRSKPGCLLIWLCGKKLITTDALNCDIRWHVWILGSPPCPVQWRTAQPGCLYYADTWLMLTPELPAYICWAGLQSIYIPHYSHISRQVSHYSMISWYRVVLLRVNNLKLCAMVPWGVLAIGTLVIYNTTYLQPQCMHADHRINHGPHCPCAATSSHHHHMQQSDQA